MHLYIQAKWILVTSRINDCYVYITFYSFTYCIITFVINYYLLYITIKNVANNELFYTISSLISTSYWAMVHAAKNY
jgi:hypothetical protein